MACFEPWESVNGIISDTLDEYKEPWNGDEFGPERPYIRDYSQTLTMKIPIALQDKNDSSKSDVIMTFDEVLQRVIEVDRLTVGIPKLIYLVGWNALGHDDKYPSWDIVNPFLCRNDENPVEKLRWLMREAIKYNTSISLHINSTDAYQDSPLWDECVSKGLISTRNGELFVTASWSGKDAYQINYKLAWETGFYKNQVDNLIKMLPELKLAGSIHSDAFLCRWSDQSSYEEEQSARRQMIRYWRDCGIDLTSEFMYGTHGENKEDVLGALNGNNVANSGLVGLMPYAWHLAQSESFWQSRPASLLAGGDIPHINDPFIKEEGWERIAFLYGCSMHGEGTFLSDCQKIKNEGAEPLWDIDFSKQFFTQTLVYCFLNQYKILQIKNEGDKTVLKKENDVTVMYNGVLEESTVTMKNVLIRKGNDIFVPVSWIKEPSVIIAYSRNGYSNRRWVLPSEWSNFNSVKISIISKKTKMTVIGNVPVSVDNSITFSLQENQAVLILPVEEADEI